jgi:hypothetical protein
LLELAEEEHPVTTSPRGTIPGVREIRVEPPQPGAPHACDDLQPDHEVGALLVEVPHLGCTLADAMPYTLVGPGDVVLQVGAPSDTLRSGRSRGMHLALRTAPTGRAVIIEPEPSSAAAFVDAARPKVSTTSP